MAAILAHRDNTEIKNALIEQGQRRAFTQNIRMKKTVEGGSRHGWDTQLYRPAFIHSR